MKTRLLLSTLFTFSFLLFTFSFLPCTAQVPKGFNYQAIARTSGGDIIANTPLPVSIAIQTSLTGGTLIYEELFSSITTNQFGLINLVVGTGAQTGGTALSFSAINWNQTLFLKTSVKYPSSSPTWTDMGTSQIWSVPYALVANGVSAKTKLSVTSANDANRDSALFEVKRADGQTVFAVYPEAVNIYVPRSTKGAKGGFSVGGYDGSKAKPQDYFRVTPDSVRIYIDPTPAVTKGAKGGFSVGGYDESKGINNMYFNLTPATAVNTVDASPQILWYPTKNAFLAGNVHIGSVDSVGDYSTALGYQSIAMGKYSQAFGYRAKALGNYSTSIGKNSVAGSKSPVANNAFAFGDASKAIGSNSYAFGSSAEATGANSISFGVGAHSTQTNSMALGVNSIASGNTSMSIGNNSQASNDNALALGNGTIASGTNSTAMGYQSQAQGDKSISIGSYYSFSYSIPIISLGKGDSGGSKGFDDLLPIRPITPITTLLRVFNRANIAQGQYSVAIGNGNLAQNGGLVFGSNSNAIKFGAVALGTGASANEANSAAIGYNTNTKGIYSMAFGNNLYANSYGELALGQWNDTISGTPDSWNENDLLLTVGNGVNADNKSNALTIYKNGKSILRGRYAVSTFNNKTIRFLYNPITHMFYIKDYVYGIYTNLSRDDAAIEYYYSGYFTSTGTEGTYYGEYADTRTGGSVDVAEYIHDTQANTEPADVVVADPINKESVLKSSKPYQTSVVGVISTKPSMTMGMELVTDEKTGSPLENAKPAARLALTGRVPVKVTGENGPIVPGDMLTSSSTPGYAMKWTLLDVSKAKDFEEMKSILAENERRRNAIIGKAVESFPGTGTGKIIVLISLQ